MLTQLFEVGLTLPKVIQPYRETGRAGVQTPPPKRRIVSPAVYSGHAEDQEGLHPQ